MGDDALVDADHPELQEVSFTDTRLKSVWVNTSDDAHEDPFGLRA
ncbi:hypothetical protein [uncultured Aeromicrobium sp.]|nr:hypothetical protein [uncultured Aeromicrobium sp.]